MRIYIDLLASSSNHALLQAPAGEDLVVCEMVLV